MLLVPYVRVLQRQETTCSMCAYSSQIWEHIARGILCGSYTNVWSEIVSIIGDETMERKRLFCVRYAFQAVLYAVWRERNKIIHGDKLLPLTTLKRMIDKWIRNKITLMRNHGVKGTGELMQFWFFTRV